MIGICDIGAFDAACKDAADVQDELEEKTARAGFGRITFRKYRGAVMTYVPSGDGDGCGPVRELLESGTCISIQHDFYGDEEGLSGRCSEPPTRSAIDATARRGLLRGVSDRDPEDGREPSVFPF
jgi:hypothetical protein